MSQLLAYSGLTTKVRAMSKNLISPEEYEHIMSFQSVNEMIGFLQNHPAYSHIFENVDTSDLHRGGLEKLLLLSEYHSFSRIYNFSSLKGRRYLSLYFVRYEVHLIKQMIREIMDANSISIDIAPVCIYFDKFSDIQLRQLVTCTNLSEFIETLRGSKYYVTLKRVQEIDNATLFDYELSLDLLMFSLMWNKSRKYLSGTDLKIVTEIYGSTIDMLNLQWIFRSKKYYNMTSSQIYSLILPVRYKLTKEQIQKMVDAETTQALSDFMAESRYAKFMTIAGDHSLEHLYKVVLDSVHRKNQKQEPYSLATVNLYLYNKRREIKKLITLTECIRYSYTTAEMKAILN